MFDAPAHESPLTVRPLPVVPTPRRAGEPPPRLSVADFVPETLCDFAREQGIHLDLTRARKVFAAAVGRGESILSVGAVSIPVREKLAELLELPRLGLVDRQMSPTDGFTKYLWSLPDGRQIESVRIPIPCEPPDSPEGRAAREAVQGEWKGKRKKYVVCVSSQVGCALGCAFCATATLGWTRNLTAGEIVAQILAIRADSDRPIGGVVFMGMGEPFQNYDAVVRAATALGHPCGPGISGTDITISTAGIVPGIRRYTAEGHRFRLAISLSSARPDRRRVLMPIEKAYPTPELVDAIRDHARVVGGRVTVAYVALGGPEGNLTEADAVALGALLRDVPIRLDLIDYNGEVGGFLKPTAEELHRFRNWLDPLLKQPVVRRYSGGKDIDAACGMLAARHGDGSAEADPSVSTPVREVT